VNHLLAADKVVPSRIVIPVSATIAGTAKGRAEYDQVLEVFSKPFMQNYVNDYRLGRGKLALTVSSPILSFYVLKMQNTPGGIWS